MIDILLLITCLVLFIIQIVLLVKAIKIKGKRLWISLFCLEIIPTIILMVLYYYYENIAPRGGIMPGLSYMSEVLTCIGACILYLIMFFITMIIGIILFEKSKKSN